MELDNFPTFMHRGEKHCPKCGKFGNQEEKEKIRFFKCPGCETEFTGEMVLTATDHEIVWENN